MADAGEAEREPSFRLNRSTQVSDRARHFCFTRAPLVLIYRGALILQSARTNVALGSDASVEPHVQSQSPQQQRASPDRDVSTREPDDGLARGERGRQLCRDVHARRQS